MTIHISENSELYSSKRPLATKRVCDLPSIRVSIYIVAFGFHTLVENPKYPDLAQ